MGNRATPNIWQLQAQGNIQGIIQALDTLDPSIRRRAINALKALDAIDAIPKLETLQEREFNPEIKDMIKATLQHLKRNQKKSENPDAEQQKKVLLQQLETHEPDKMIAAMKQLELLNDRTAVENLVVVFRNPNHSPKVRLTAAELLLKWDSALANISLLGALRKDDWQVRRNAAAVLGQIEADWCAEPLIEVMKRDSNPVVKKTAAAALRRINTPEAIEALKRSEFATPAEQATAAPAKPNTGILTQPQKPGGTGILTPPPPRPTTGNTGMLTPPPPRPTTGNTGMLTPPPPPPATATHIEPTPLLPDLNALPQPAWIRRKRPTQNPTPPASDSKPTSSG